MDKQEEPPPDGSGDGISLTEPESQTTSVPEQQSPARYTEFPQLRNRLASRSADFMESVEGGFVMVPQAENEVEAQRISNNYLFGFKKWKSHVTSRPLSERSDIVKALYADKDTYKPDISTLRFANFVYVFLFGWWLSLVYIIMCGLMFVTYFGRNYARFLFKLARYFFWPFGKFVTKSKKAISLKTHVKNRDHESAPLLQPDTSSRSASPMSNYMENTSQVAITPVLFLYIFLCIPVLVIVHAVVIFFSWFFVISIPIAKLNLKAITHIIFIPPEALNIETPSSMSVSQDDIIVYTHKAVNLYYYKYTVDGMNVILVNLLVFVILAVTVGYADQENYYTSDVVKFTLALLAIIPLAYYIGMAITSIAAQSNFAVGAVLNATFGSVVEITLYVTALIKGIEKKTDCYEELVKSALTGTLLATMLFIPGICMVIGGLKHRTQKFNIRSTGVSSSLLFVSVAGAFAATIFSKAYGQLQCRKCVYTNTTIFSNDTASNHSVDMQCTQCEYSIFGVDGNDTLYQDHIKPLVYAVCIVLPLSYIIGLIFTLKTHRRHIYDTYLHEMSKTTGEHSHGHSVAHWGRIKSGIILLVSTVLMSLSADLVTEHIQPLLNGTGVSIYFIGVTLLALVPDIPEIVNGIQFALQNNISLSIEVGSCIAVQVCMLQIPVLVLVDVIHPINFYLVFNDLHLWSVVFAVIVMNYMFQDGKSDYFQGSILTLLYLTLILMYYFFPSPEHADC